MLETDNAVLVLVDVQVKLARVIHERERLIESAARLVRGMQALGVPVVRTEQNPDGLGPTAPELAELLPDAPRTKFTFSCCRQPGFTDSLASLGRRQVVLAGIETHVCVYQTAVDLLAGGYEVQVVADAVSSRTPENRRIGLARMAAEGAAVTSVEMALFELLGTADRPEFKEILKVVK